MAGIKLDSPGETFAIEEGTFPKVFSKTKKWIKTKDNEGLEMKWKGTAAMIAVERRATISK